jgi:hypothetical protein
MKQTWNDDWSGRLQEALRTNGFGSVREFLDRYPCESYLTVGDRLAPWVAGMQIQRAQFDEAMRAGGVGHAVADALAREICEALPKGWRNDETGISGLAAAIGRWVGTLVANASLLEARSAAVAISAKVRAEPPKEGWIPSGATDPVLISVLRASWPSLQFDADV